MKQLRKVFLIVLCIGVVMGVTACGSSNTADDNGATGNGQVDDTGNNQGVVDEIGDDIENGVDDLEDDVSDDRNYESDGTENNVNNDNKVNDENNLNNENKVNDKNNLNKTNNR